MHVPVTPIDLKERAVQQLRVMGLDNERAFVRKRAIGRSINQFALTKIELERERDKLFAEQTSRAPYAERSTSTAERLEVIAQNLKATQKRISLLNAQVAEAERELAEIETWHPPTGRLMDRVLQELGVTTIRAALPGFDDGYSEGVQSR